MDNNISVWFFCIFSFFFGGLFFKFNRYNINSDNQGTGLDVNCIHDTINQWANNTFRSIYDKRYDIYIYIYIFLQLHLRPGGAWTHDLWNPYFSLAASANHSVI